MLKNLVISRQEAAALKEELMWATLNGVMSVSGFDDAVESINRRTVPS